MNVCYTALLQPFLADTASNSWVTRAGLASSTEVQGGRQDLVELRESLGEPQEKSEYFFYLPFLSCTGSRASLGGLEGTGGMLRL